MRETSPMEHATLIERLEALGRDLSATRVKLSRLSTEELGTQDIPTATAELREIVAQTEGAANRIMDGCEAIDRMGGLLLDDERPDVSKALFAATQCIYVACEFQDLTGQRIAIVVASLREIEQRMFEVTAALRVPGRSAEDAGDGRIALQATEPAMSQQDVDAMMRDDAA